MATQAPNTIADAAEIIRHNAKNGCSLQLAGNGSRHRAETGPPALSARNLSGIQNYQPEDWTISVGAGTPVAEIIDVVASHGQRLAFDPPNHQRIFGSGREPTIGGAIAANASDPGTAFRAGLRHQVAGMQFINGKSKIIEAGSRAIKNVAGIDLARGLIGSWGNLALICNMVLRLVPDIQGETIAVQVRDVVEAMKLFDRARTEGADISGAIYLPTPAANCISDGFSVADSIVLLRFESPESAQYFRKPISRSDCQLIDHPHAARLWEKIRDLDYLDGTSKSTIWRVLVPAAIAPDLFHQVTTDHRVQISVDGGGTLFWIKADNDDNPALITTLRQFSGVRVSCYYQPNTCAPFAVQPKVAKTAVERLSTRIKEAFDPLGVFSSKPYLLQKTI